MNKQQLFCFTYAGGNASFFDVIENDLPDISIEKLEYAGHGSRHTESYYRSFDELANDLFDVFLSRYSGGDYALFGYSMGTISLVEVLFRIINNSLITKPKCVFLAAHEPKTKEELKGYSDSELDERVKNRTIQFGAVPDTLLFNESFWRVYLPLYRSDYSLISKYKFEDLTLKTDIPATFFYSETDTPRTDMNHWKRFFIGDCEFHEFVGNHFFIQEHHKEIARLISCKMNQENQHGI